ncbi:MAG: hypothetical protein AAED33_00050 [Paracoccaceae bacterium]|jgi:hypothetical protein
MANSNAEHADMALKLVDLTRYPIEDISQGKGATFLAECQQQMEEHGWCSFDGFIKPDALSLLEDEANTLLPTAETLTITRTIYQGEVDPNAPKGDPRGAEYTHVTRQLANDQIPMDGMLQRLYHSEILTNFAQHVQKKKTFFRSADEFQALNVVSLEPDCWHAWHYDTTECTITLLLQAAEEGGEFAFIPNSRTDETEDRESVDKLLAGDMSVAKMFTRGAGTFTMFRGGYSLHGVTKVEGTIPRVTAIMTYSQEPNTVLSDDVNINIYGKRVAKILADRHAG